MAKNSGPRPSVVPSAYKPPPKGRGPSRGSTVPKPGNRQQTGSSSRRAERQILNLLSLLALSWLVLVGGKLWQVQVKGDIPAVYVDDWAKDRVQSLIDTGCLYVDTASSKPWMRLSGVVNGEADFCGALRQKLGATETKQDLCNNDRYIRLTNDKQERDVARLYCQDDNLLRKLNKAIVNGRENSLLSGAKVEPFRFEDNVNAPDGRTVVVSSAWHWRGEEQGKGEFQALQAQVNGFRLDQRFRLSGPRQANAVKEKLKAWLQNAQVVPPLVFVNPFFISDAAESERQRSVPRGFVVTRDLTVLASNGVNEDADAPIRRLHDGDPALAALFGKEGGVEAQLDEWLKLGGTHSGVCQTADSIDGAGRGCDVMLTIDQGLSDKVYQALGEATRSGGGGADTELQQFQRAWHADDADPGQQLVAVLLDVASGEVLAATQFPSLEQAGKNTAFEEHVFPGSTFKVLTALAAMETGVLVPGAANRLPNTPLWKAPPCMSNPIERGRIATDPLPLDLALIHSQNQYFARVATQIEAAGEGGFAKALEDSLAFDSLSLGVGASDGNRPLLRLAKNKLETDEGCPANSTARAGFGQGVVRVTPLFMAYTALAVANGGEPPAAPSLVKSLGRWQTPPAVGQEEAPPQWLELYPLPTEKKRRFSAVAAQDVGAMMCQVAEIGTAKKYLSSKAPAHFPVRVAIKTGTAEYSKEKGRGLHDLSVIGFYPAEKPQVAFYIGARRIRPASDKGSFLASDILVPIAAKLIRSTLKPLGIDQQAHAAALCPPRPQPAEASDAHEQN